MYLPARSFNLWLFFRQFTHDFFWLFKKNLIYPVIRLPKCSSDSFLISGQNVTGDDIHMWPLVPEFLFVSYFLTETEIL